MNELLFTDGALCAALVRTGADEAAPRAQLPTLLALAAASGRFVRMTPEERWAVFEAALGGPRPSVAFEAMRQHRALAVLLPELPGLFGVPQLSDGPDWQDVGEHQWRFIDETARAGAPLVVRFAALVHKLGKAGTPREIWPSHYKHELRAHAAIDALARRMAVPPEMLDLAHLGVDELDRVHKVADLRAGPIAQLLQRVQARERPERFERLLLLAACDWAAYPGHCVAEYPKAARLRLALRASDAVPAAGLSADDLLQAQAEAVHAALRVR
ncbi:hypothetical protein [Pelomonas cellulosilytica]|uniref:Uncharacterized protein n=1 Tax=Pelomonas cellulosilytica TaxID=2906762 RepID=A0ABS8Y156_9BURK|nr:hypothetical protein [Pelomonas sp. P8]MCE4556797.1 hypothetical protein [Pelomonas sp. P8]